MKSYFMKIASNLDSMVTGRQAWYINYSGEQSDFCRLNNCRVRQAGHVDQHDLDLTLVDNDRQASMCITLTRNLDQDASRLKQVLSSLASTVESLPKDPFFQMSESDLQSEKITRALVPDRGEILEDILSLGRGLDITGIYAGGKIYRGFASSFGQRNWHETANFNFDWSLIAETDKAVKLSYAGESWDRHAFARKIENGRQQLEILKLPAWEPKPGKYRVFLSPTALNELIDILAWGGFGLKSQRTRNSSLCDLIDGTQDLSPRLSLTEDTRNGVAPNFNHAGFMKPDTVALIRNGQHSGSLVSPRSSKEFDIAANGADNSESPASISMAAGDLIEDEVLARIGDGILINNLWYLNYSDRPKGRVTGMTRFATLRVEKGEITQPVSVMRFDESIYRMLGENLEALTQEKEMLLSNATYGCRSTDSANLPGALIRDFTLTL